jgi:hypothetical protein
MRKTSIFGLIIFSCLAQAFSESRDFSRIDAAVLAMPTASSVQSVASAIEFEAADDWEKVRAVFIWMTDNIAYDADAFFKGTQAVTSSAGVFRTGKSVCAGYSDLFRDLADRLGLETMVLNGYAKGYGYRAGERFPATNHAWNAVRINGQWRLFDSTWGAGYVDGAKFVKRYSELWFDTPPELFAISHLPEDGRWTLLGRDLSLKDFEALPYVETYVLDGLSSLGVPTDAILSGIRSGGLPRSWRYPGYDIRVVEAPMSATLSLGATYSFRVESPDLAEMYAQSGGKWIPFVREGSLFSASFAAGSGEIRVSGRIAYQGTTSYWPILIYQGK